MSRMIPYKTESGEYKLVEVRSHPYCREGEHWVYSYRRKNTIVNGHCAKNPDRGADEVYDTSYGRSIVIAKGPDEEGDFNFAVYDDEDGYPFEGSGKSFKEARSKARKIARKRAYNQEIVNGDL